jgi:hypothetical protein
MLVNGDILRITDKQTLAGQDVLNVYFYEASVITPGVTLPEIIVEFSDNLVDQVRGVQSPDLNHARIVAENVTNGIDIDSATVNLAGQDGEAGPVLPNYVAGSYRLFVDDKTTRRGSKRISGIGEDRVEDNDYNPSSVSNALLNTALASPIEVTGTPVGEATLTPVIVGRDELGHLDLDRISVITSAANSETISSQVSRKAALT